MPDLKIPYYDQWLGPWAMLPEHVLSTFDIFRRTDLHLHLQTARQDLLGAEDFTTREDGGDGVAIINLTGKLMKQQPSLGGGTSTVQARRDIRAAANDQKVKGIMLRVDSPGGTAAGTQELADEIAAAGAKKPVEAYIEDLGASAAYWAASQASRITANATGMVGSIGTYGVIEDYSGWAAKEGVKVHVVKAGAFKGAGTPGTEVTPDQLADMQRIVDGLNEQFIVGVAKGRKKGQDYIRDLADGRVHLAADAQNMGLIDAVGSFESALAEFQKTISKRSTDMQVTQSTELAADALEAAAAAHAVPQASVVNINVRAANAEEDDYDDDEEEEKAKKAAAKAAKKAKAEEGEDDEEQKKNAARPAAYAEIVAACIGADAEFIVGQLAAKATVQAAQSAWMTEQNRRIETAKQSPGVQAVGTRRTSQTAAQTVDCGPVDAWNSLVEDRMQAANCDKATATRWCVANHAEEHLAFLAAHNARYARA